MKDEMLIEYFILELKSDMFNFELFPNEIIGEIFNYLHSDEIIYSFLNINIRFDNLCLPYIERINLSRSSNMFSINSIINEEIEIK